MAKPLLTPQMTPQMTPQNEDYLALLQELKAQIRSAQYEALKTVNRQLIELYWEIGRAIVKRQEGKTWGKKVVENLAQDLKTEFPGLKGFSASNLWRMKLFYETYVDSAKLAPLVREVGWSHNLLILEKCNSALEREFYLRMTRKQSWTKGVLKHRIESRSYERTLSNQTNFSQTLPPHLTQTAQLTVRDEYLLDFLDLTEEHSERELERAILTRMDAFLQQMGGLFTFVGSQYRLEVGQQEFYIDLLLFHRRLQCLVAIDLKIGSFQPEHVGKMQFYLAVLNDQVRLPSENPSIGIVLCRSKEKAIAQYALKDSDKPIGVATYKLVSELPDALKDELPAPEEIARILEDL